MRKIVSLILGAAMLLSVSLGFAEEVNLSIITLNDFHGNIRATKKIPGAARVAGAVKELKRRQGENVFFVAAGDMLAGTMEANTYKGLKVVEILNKMELDLDAVGNHAYDFEPEAIYKQARAAKFPFVAANIIDNRTKELAKPYIPYKILSKQGVKIGFVGLTTEETMQKATKKNLVGITVLPPVKVAQKYIDEVKKNGADMVVLLTHIASEQDKDGSIKGEITGLLDKVKGVDAAITSHSHLPVAGVYNNVPVLQAKCYGEMLGLVNIIYDTDKKAAKTIKVSCIPVKDMPGFIDTKVEKIQNKVIKDIDAKFSKPFAVNKNLLTNDMVGQSTVSEYFTDLICVGADADIALFNGGGVRAELPAGDVSYRNIKNIFPFDNVIVKMYLTGKDIRAILERGVTTDPELRMLRFSGLKVKADVTKPEGSRIKEVTLLDGSPLDDAKEYIVATNDFFSSGGDGFIAFKNGKIFEEMNQVADFCAKLVEAQKTIDYKGPDGRLVY